MSTRIIFEITNKTSQIKLFEALEEFMYLIISFYARKMS